MAIFYEHIKGCGSSSTGTGTSDGCWSWIKWSDSTSTDYIKKHFSNSDNSFVSIEAAPEIWINSTNTSPTESTLATSLGKIILGGKYNEDYDNDFPQREGAGNKNWPVFWQRIYGQCQFTSGVFQQIGFYKHNDTTSEDITHIGGIEWDSRTGKEIIDFYVKEPLQINQKTGTANTDTYKEQISMKHWFGPANGGTTGVRLIANQRETISSNQQYIEISDRYNQLWGRTRFGGSHAVVMSNNGGLYVGQIGGSDTDTVSSVTSGGANQQFPNLGNGVIKAENKCEALYFNATSDKRAKSNITPTQFSALAVVKNLPIYTFNYNNKPEEKSIGLIAQEAAEYDLEGFNMVDNLDASGQGMDFMQMKESKLVYVLWKAVQELSVEVEELKAQLNSK